MDIRTIRFNGVTFGFQSDQHAAEFVECFATSEKAEALGAALKLHQEALAEGRSDDAFAVCPHCFKNDGYVNAGRTHVFFCKGHNGSWIAGSNLFSSWKDQSEVEQRRMYAEAGIDGSERIEPFFWPLTVEEWAEREAHEANRPAPGEEIPF